MGGTILEQDLRELRKRLQNPLMLRKKCIEPLGESWSEFKFLKSLAERIDASDKFPWKTEEEFVSSILEPSGFSFDYLLNEKPEGDFFSEKKYSNDICHTLFTHICLYKSIQMVHLH